MARKKRSPLEDVYRPCQHLIDFKEKHGVQAFLRILQHCTRAGPFSKILRKEGEAVACCALCGRSRGRLYACLLCAKIGCWTDPDAPHARHLAQAQPGHEIAMDVERAELFCCICGDQVYDPEFDRAVICIPLAAAKANSAGQDAASSSSSCVGMVAGTNRKRRKAELPPWFPTLREQSFLRRRSIPLNEKSFLPWGLRGLNNLGSTCFMNSVLQALLHTPPLRNFFLSGRHNCHSRQQGRGPQQCLGCDLDTIFSAAFSGDRTPYSPAHFLLSWWQHATDLAGHSQQDAHEFFISVIDGIHANVGKSPPMTGRKRSAGVVGECDCIVHRIFSGLLRSDVTCTVCGSSSTKYDPCIDVSLDLEPASHLEKTYPDQSTSNSRRRSTRAPQASCSEFSTLYGCLDCFTRPERLGCNEKLFCQNCKIQQESVKQMSFRKLPLVLCLHIKRFEHLPAQNMFRKIDRYLQFPFVLEMSPYLSSSVLRSRHGNRLAFMDEDEGMCSSCAEFDLFAVVSHFGKLDSGHYITYLRLAGLWYRCDDSWVMQVSEDVVRASQGYMLFYVQRTSSYRTSEGFNRKGLPECKGSKHNHALDTNGS